LVSHSNDLEIAQLLAKAHHVVERGGSQCAGERLFAVVELANGEGAARIHCLLTQIVSELGFVNVAIFRTRATTAHAVRALELLELRSRPLG
jgi:hypothetical protein